MKLLESILKHEGFRAKPYQCTEGVWTIGHGITSITYDESKHIVQGRIASIRKSILANREHLLNCPDEVLNVLTEMAFQMGIAGLMNFKNTLSALENEDYITASEEMLDSKWAIQTPERAKQMSNIIRALA
jgi:lysozyme